MRVRRRIREAAVHDFCCARPIASAVGYFGFHDIGLEAGAEENTRRLPNRCGRILTLSVNQLKVHLNRRIEGGKSLPGLWLDEPQIAHSS